MDYTLYMVSGAPGSGKSTILQAFIGLKSGYMAFDIDWLAETASGLAGKDIYFSPSTWKAYSTLWFEVLHSVYKNGYTPVFFSPNDPKDIERYGQPAWCREIHWFLLDCEDRTRAERLARRPGWTEARMAEAISDAHDLRQAISIRADTGLLTPEAAAAEILVWLQQIRERKPDKNSRTV